MTGEKSLRMRRLFGPDGRLLLLAMDHAPFMGPQPGLDLPTLGTIVRAGADGVMTTFGTARRLARQPELLGSAALVVSLNVDSADPEADVERALRLGADSVKVLAFGGDQAHWTALGRFAQISERWGLPLQAEVIPGGFEQRDQHTPENIALVARHAAELGADYVKTLYTGDPASMARVVEGATVPVLILGGARANDDESLMHQVSDALAAGGAGVAFGRNLWGHADPAGITARLVSIVHASAPTNGRVPADEVAVA
jgi:DhnA family fructose-bisphosphate aldolase class Ia